MSRRAKSATQRRVVVLYNEDYDSSMPDYDARADVKKTAHAVRAALSALPAKRISQTLLLPVKGNDTQFIRQLDARTDTVFNLCETLAGRGAHEPFVPQLLDFMGIPYTGSGPLTLAIAVRKDMTKQVLVSRGVATPASVRLTSVPSTPLPFAFPAIVKPAQEDGSLGISDKSVVRTAAALKRQVRTLLRDYAQPVLVEQYIEGREIIVPMLGTTTFAPLPVTEIDYSAMPAHLPKIITYEGKWVEDSDDYRGSTSVLAPRLSSDLEARVRRVAAEAYHALDCRGYGRVDMRIDAAGQPYVIEVNPNCDFSPGGGLFRACKKAKMTYTDLVERVLSLADVSR